MEHTIAGLLLDDAEALEQRRQAHGTDPYRLGEASDALADLDTLATSSPEAFKVAVSLSAIEGVVDTLLAEIRRIEQVNSLSSD